MAAESFKILRRPLAIALLGTGYFAAARLGLLLATVHGSVSPVWPATGVAIAALILGGQRMWPGVALGAFLANALTPVPLVAVAGIAAGNTLEAVVGAWLFAQCGAVLRRWQFDHVAAPLVSASCGVLSLGGSGAISWPIAGTLWQTWWVGDALGALIVAPFLVALRASLRARRPWNARLALKAALLAGITAMICRLVFFQPVGTEFLFAVFPMLLLAVAWFGSTGVALTALVISGVGISAAFFGSGPFVGDSLNSELLHLQLFLTSVGIAALVLPIYRAVGSLVLPGAVLLAGWTLSGWLFSSLYHDRLNDDAGKFRALTVDVANSIRSRLARYEDALRGGAGLFVATKSAGADEWRTFAELLRLRERYPGIDGISMIFPVREADLPGFLSAVRARGVPGFELKASSGESRTAGDRNVGERYLITYTEPMAAHRDLPGVNIASDANRRSAAEEARDEGQLRMTRSGPASSGGSRPGFSLYLPLYRLDAPLETVGERRAAFAGWVEATFVMKPFLDSVLATHGDEVRLSLFDGDSTGRADLLYAGPGSHRLAERFENVARLEIGGRPFTMGWNRGPRFVTSNQSPAVWAATSSALVSLLMAGLVVSLQLVGRRANALAADRTAALAAAQKQLRLANDRLEQRVLARTRDLEAANRGLVASENRVRFLADTMPQLVWTARPDGTIESANRGWSDYLGVDEAATVQTIQSGGIVHPEDEAVTHAEWAAMLQEGRAARGELRLRRADGVWRWHLWRAHPQRDASGKIERFVGTSTDIHDQKLAADILEQRVAARTTELAASHRMFERLFESAPDAIVLADRAGMIVHVNARTETLFGYSRGELAGKEVALLLPARFRARHGQHLAGYFANPHAREMGAGLELFALRKNGAEFPVDIMLSPLETDVGGQALAVIRDITERKLAESKLRDSEERFRILTTAAFEGICISENGRIADVNDQFLKLCGYERAEIIGKQIVEMIVPEDRLKVAEAIQSGRETAYESRLIRKDGSVFQAETQAKTLHLADRAMRMTAVRDITERKRLEDNLAVARDQALMASRLKSEFMATMSHEIRTPMNGVIGMASLLAETPLNTQQQEMSAVILRSAENLLRIINDILDFSKIEAGKLRIESVEFDLRELVEETLAMLAPRAHDKHLELACDLDPKLANLLFGDAGRIGQVLTNLVGNAIKFTQHGEVVVTAREVSADPERTRFRVAVRDTGIGVPTAAQSFLFQPFTQADGTTTRRFGGTGLGLAISRQLVELMNGQIGYESADGGGSTFWFELDLPRRPGRAKTPATLPPKLRVLVVDDTAVNRQIVLAQLARFGVKADAAEDGPTALALLRSGLGLGSPYELVLLDWQMPDMDGIDLAVQIRAEAGLSDTPLVMLSSSAPFAEEAKDLIDAVKFAAFLTKPVRETQLHRCLLDVLKPQTKPAAVAAVVPPKPRPARGLRLLLAEDNTTNQLVVQMLAANMGHTVDCVSDGAEALERLARESYDIVLMDCQMPQLDGYETTRRIRSGAAGVLNPRMPVIALTAYAMAGDRAKCLAAGMDDFLAKPIRARELEEAILRAGAAASDPRAATNGTALLAASAPEPPVLDLSLLESMRELPGRNGPSLLPELISVFSRDEPARHQEIAQLVEERRGPELAHVAHAFAGTCAIIGAQELRKAVLALEQAALTEAWTDAPSLLEAMEMAGQRVRAALSEMVKSLNECTRC